MYGSCFIGHVLPVNAETVALVQLLMGISERTRMTTETDLLTIINKL